MVGCCKGGASYLRTLLHQHSDDVVLDTAVNSDHADWVTFPEDANFWRRYLRHQVPAIRVREGKRLALALKLDATEHRALVAQLLGQHACVDAGKARDALFTAAVALVGVGYAESIQAGRDMDHGSEHRDSKRQPTSCAIHSPREVCAFQCE